MRRRDFLSFMGALGLSARLPAFASLPRVPINASASAELAFVGGYEILPNGLLVQWGESAAPPGTRIDVQFHRVFPESFMAFQTSEEDDGNHLIVVERRNDFCSVENSVPRETRFYWVALGRSERIT